MELILKNIPVKSFDVSPVTLGAGIVFALPARAVALQWQTFFVTNPSVVAIDLEMSLDGINWDAVDTSTVIAGEIRTFSTIGGKFVRGFLRSITGGAGLTMIIICELA